jgi:hypothetical protein
MARTMDSAIIRLCSPHSLHSSRNVAVAALRCFISNAPRTIEFRNDLARNLAGKLVKQDLINRRDRGASSA